MTEPAKQQLHYSFVKIMTGSDLSRRRLPQMSAVAADEGPTVWLTACAHGDEVGGIVVIQEIFRRLRRTPLRRGALHAFPMMNPMGFETVSRHIGLTEEDLNRSFPGRADGSLAQRIAARIFATIVDTAPALVVDIHNDWRRSIPYAVLDRRPAASAAVYAEAETFATASGFLVIREGNEPHMAQSLTHNLIQNGIPAYTLELGESFVVNEGNVDLGLRSLWSQLAALEMVDTEDEPFRYELPGFEPGGIYAYSETPLASTSGILRFIAKPGQVLEAGAPFARVYNAFGKPQETLRTEARVLVLAQADTAMTYPGMPVMAFAEL